MTKRITEVSPADEAKTGETIKNDERPGWHAGRSKSFLRDDGGPRRWPGSVGWSLLRKPQLRRFVNGPEIHPRS